MKESEEQEKLLQQNKELLEVVAAYQARETLTSQARMNEWLMTEITKLKEGINQLIDIQNQEGSQEYKEEPDEEVEEAEEEKTEKKKIKYPK